MTVEMKYFVAFGKVRLYCHYCLVFRRLVTYIGVVVFKNIVDFCDYLLVIAVYCKLVTQEHAEKFGIFIEGYEYA